MGRMEQPQQELGTGSQWEGMAHIDGDEQEADAVQNKVPVAEISSRLGAPQFPQLHQRAAGDTLSGTLKRGHQSRVAPAQRTRTHLRGLANGQHNAADDAEDVDGGL